MGVHAKRNRGYLGRWIVAGQWRKWTRQQQQHGTSWRWSPVGTGSSICQYENEERAWWIRFDGSVVSQCHNYDNSVHQPVFEFVDSRYCIVFCSHWKQLIQGGLKCALTGNRQIVMKTSRLEEFSTQCLGYLFHLCWKISWKLCSSVHQRLSVNIWPKHSINSTFNAY